jgi:hypothetical protein
MGYDIIYATADISSILIQRHPAIARLYDAVLGELMRTYELTQMRPDKTGENLRLGN